MPGTLDTPVRGAGVFQEIRAGFNGTIRLTSRGIFPVRVGPGCYPNQVAVFRVIPVHRIAGFRQSDHPDQPYPV